MRIRRWEAWLFAATGWDPTWQRRLSPVARAVWSVMVSVLSVWFGAAALLAWWYVPPDRRWMPLAMAGGWLVTVAIVQVLVRREVLRRIDVEADQIAARQIQAHLLPASLPEASGFELAAHYSPMREIGGDFYDVVPIDDRRWLLALADVSGKGTAAALLTASLQGLLHFARANEPSLEAVASAINRHLVRYAPAGRFVTMVFGVLDLDARRFRYVNAGHNPPLGLTAGGETLRLPATGLPLGMLEDVSYEAAEVALPAGTMCLFYTDGLTEREDRRGEMFEEARVIDALAGVRDRSAAGIVQAVVDDVTRFAGGVEAADDTALLVVRSI